MSPINILIPSVYAQSANAAAPSFVANMFPLFVIMGIVYFILIRPQKKRELVHRTFLDNVKKGDEVLLQNGIMGKVTGVADRLFTIEIAPNVRIKTLKSAVAGSANIESAEPKKKAV